MKDNIKKSIDTAMIGIDIIFFVYTIIMFILKESISSLIYPINASFFVLLTFFSIIFFGFIKNRKNKSKIKTSNAILIISNSRIIIF